MITHSGKVIDFTNLKHDDFVLSDIARGLASEKRWCGQLRVDLSVACHSEIVEATIASDGGSLDGQRAGLLHDASEAYLRDISVDVKKLLPDYQALEERVQNMIFEKFLGRIPDHSEYKAADRVVAHWEFRALHPEGEGAGELLPYWNYRSRFTTEEEADAFLLACHRLEIQ